MVQFRPRAREIIAKIVYYGPALGGKTTNLRTLYAGYPAGTRGELVIVPAGGDRTMFFDFLPVEAGTMRGMRMRVQLYTVPGQVHYNATRQIVLRGVDAVVFVADCQRELMRSNRDSWEDLKKGVGHHVGSANPGERGNAVYSGHNDVYGEVFRRLEEVKVGDRITVYAAAHLFRYEVKRLRIVGPKEVSVMAPSPDATLTLITCYPYRVDTQRVVVIAVLVE